MNKKKKSLEKLTLFNRSVLEKLGQLEGDDWLKSQIDNFNEGSFLSAFKFYEKEKSAAREDEYLISILGKSEYFVLGNGEVVIKENHHALNDAKQIGFRII